MGWKIICVGTGSAFNIIDFQSNFLIEASSGKKLLIDCGSLAPIPLNDLGINAGNIGDEIDSIYISHLHGDHIGGLEMFAFCTYFNPKAPKPRLYCVGGRGGLMTQLWNKSLRGGLESEEGKVNDLRDYFECVSLRINDDFIWENLEFKPVQTVHIMNGREIVSSYGLLIREIHREDGKNYYADGDPVVFLTTDTQFCPNQISKFYDMADVILHDCETAPYHSKVHAHYDELKTLPDETKAKMWLYHYQPDPPYKRADPLKDGFLGFLHRKQILEFE